MRRKLRASVTTLRREEGDREGERAGGDRNKRKTNTGPKKLCGTKSCRGFALGTPWLSLGIYAGQGKVGEMEEIWQQGGRA